MGEIQEIASELCGAIIGDGWIQSNKQCFFLAGDPKEDKEYYDSHICKIVSRILVQTSPKEFPYWKVYGISIYKKEEIRKLINLELPIGKKAHSAQVPKWIRKSNKKVIMAFLRGFFDTDGCVFCQKDYSRYSTAFNSKYHSKIRLRMSSISLRLINQLYTLAKKCGFKAVKRIIKRGFKNNRNNHDVNILEINGLESIQKWFEELKPSNNKHVTKYVLWKKFKFCPPNTTIKQRKDILKKKLSPYDLY